MATAININVLDVRTLDQARIDLRTYIADLEEKANTLCNRLSTIGAVRASLDFSRAIYNGVNDVEVSVEAIPNGYAIHATGGAVLFIEFGSGVKHGGGHPRPEGYGPGTYPGKGHWNDPKGWWFPNGAVSAQGKTSDAYTHSYGNPPAAAMYNAEQEVINSIEQIAREVFEQ